MDGFVRTEGAALFHTSLLICSVAVPVLVFALFVAWLTATFFRNMMECTSHRSRHQSSAVAPLTPLNEVQQLPLSPVSLAFPERFFLCYCPGEEAPPSLTRAASYPRGNRLEYERNVSTSAPPSPRLNSHFARFLGGGGTGIQEEPVRVFQCIREEYELDY